MPYNSGQCRNGGHLLMGVSGHAHNHSNHQAGKRVNSPRLSLPQQEMYDRAPRILVATAPTNSTPSTIGPGVYWNGEKEIRSGMKYIALLSSVHTKTDCSQVMYNNYNVIIISYVYLYKKDGGVKYITTRACHLSFKRVVPPKRQTSQSTKIG